MTDRRHLQLERKLNYETERDHQGCPGPQRHLGSWKVGSVAEAVPREQVSTSGYTRTKTTPWFVGGGSVLFGAGRAMRKILALGIVCFQVLGAWILYFFNLSLL
jgi:hypothetical protein